MGRRIDGHDLSRLPKWAQRRLETLEANAAHWKAKALAVADGPEHAPVVVHHYGDEPDGGLPDETIQFFPDPKDRRTYIEVQRKSYGVEVTSGELLVVRPIASNRVLILLAEDLPRDVS